MTDKGKGTKFHSTAMKIAKRMKARAWKRQELFCPRCGVRMFFPGFENKIKRNKNPEGRQVQSEVMVTLDHFIRKCDGGTNESSNLRLICHKCNSGRHSVEFEACKYNKKDLQYAMENNVVKDVGADSGK